MLRCRKYLQKANRPCGNAVCADIWLSARRLLRYVRSVDIPRVILKFVKKTIDDSVRDRAEKACRQKGISPALLTTRFYFFDGGEFQ